MKKHIDSEQLTFGRTCYKKPANYLATKSCHSLSVYFLILVATFGLGNNFWKKIVLNFIGTCQNRTESGEGTRNYVKKAKTNCADSVL